MIPRRALPLLATPALAQPLPRVRLGLDWLINGPYAFVAVGERQGIFRGAGVDIAAQRGFGSGRVPMDLAAGSIDIGIADLTTVMRFVAQNPAAAMLVVGTLLDQAPTCAVVRADGPIRTPRDLAGKRLAAPEFDGGRQVFPVFARAVGIDPASVTWVSVAPELREPLLARREVDGITGFVTSAPLSLKALGMGPEQQRVFRYREHGLDYFYGSVILTAKAYAERNPEALRASIAGILDATRWTFANRAAAIELLRAREPLTDVAIESERMDVAMDELVDSPFVRRDGLGGLEAARLTRQLAATAEAFALPSVPAVESFVDTRFLPPTASRRL